MKDFLQRRSLRDSMLNYEKIEIFDPRIRKLSGNEIFWWFYFDSNFLIGWARQRGRALAQKPGTKIIYDTWILLRHAQNESWFAENFFCLTSFTYLVKPLSLTRGFHSGLLVLNKTTCKLFQWSYFRNYVNLISEI